MNVALIIILIIVIIMFALMIIYCIKNKYNNKLNGGSFVGIYKTGRPNLTVLYAIYAALCNEKEHSGRIKKNVYDYVQRLGNKDGLRRNLKEFLDKIAAEDYDLFNTYVDILNNGFKDNAIQCIHYDPIGADDVDDASHTANKITETLRVCPGTYIVGDVHGNYLQFFAPLFAAGIIKKVSYNWDRFRFDIQLCDTIPANSKVIYCGDIISRGVTNHWLDFVRLLMKLNVDPRVKNHIVWCLGNHDLAMLNDGGIYMLEYESLYHYSEYLKNKGRGSEQRTYYDMCRETLDQFRQFAKKSGRNQLIYHDKFNNHTFNVSHTIPDKQSPTFDSLRVELNDPAKNELYSEERLRTDDDLYYKYINDYIVDCINKYVKEYKEVHGDPTSGDRYAKRKILSSKCVDATGKGRFLYSYYWNRTNIKDDAGKLIVPRHHAVDYWFIGHTAKSKITRIDGYLEDNLDTPRTNVYDIDVVTNAYAKSANPRAKFVKLSNNNDAYPFTIYNVYVDVARNMTYKRVLNNYQTKINKICNDFRISTELSDIIQAIEGCIRSIDKTYYA